MFTKIEFDLNLELRNNTTETLSDYTLEISYPVNSTDFNVDGRIENNRKIVAYDMQAKLFPSQTKTIKLENLIIRNSNAEEILASSVGVKVFTEKGAIETNFLLRDTLVIKDVYGDKQLTPDMFQDKNYR